MGAVILCAVSIVIMVVWEKPFIKNRIKFIPGALVAVAVAIGLNELFRSMGSPLYMGGEHLVNIQVAKSPSEFFGFFTLPDLGGFLNGKVILYGFFIAIIASLETLLSIEAVDSLDPRRNVTNRNRELFAQGIGNTVSGFIGGLPLTSVIVRSSANISAGARSKKSTIFHGILLLSTLVLIPGILNMIPRAALAAILILTGYKLCKLSVFKTMFGNGKYQYIPFVITVLFIIGIDLVGIIPFLKGKGLLVGVTAGLISAFGAILHGNLKNSYFFHKDKHKEGDVIHIRLAEEVSFLNKASIRETLDHLPENSTVKIDASHTDYIDFDVLELIKEFRDIKAPLKKITLQLEGFKEVYRIENKLNVQSVH
jgi:carbonic anhydrase